MQIIIKDENKEEFETAIRRTILAAEHWCDYLEENDREDEIPAIEGGIDIVRELLRKF